jgi:hypothetical protein
MVTRRLVALLSALTLTGLTHRTALAAPQASVGLTLGVAGRAVDRALWDKTVFHGGLRGDVLFGRSANTDFGVGPYLEVLTHGFDELQFGAGASTLLPFSERLPLVLSVGMYGRSGEESQRVEPGVAAALFWGLRSYNFHGNYIITNGLLAQMRLGLGESRETSLVLAAQLDLAVLTAPVGLLLNAITGPSQEAEPVR